MKFEKGSKEKTKGHPPTCGHDCCGIGHWNAKPLSNKTLRHRAKQAMHVIRVMLSSSNG